ncbi:unnamed protein product [Symbiodinium sp. CCMP2592]|nr:unnamed protein product [Symbiodinium sp. CCMP2592]
MSPPQHIFGAALLVAVAITSLQGCGGGWGQTYETEDEAVRTLCGGSSCEAQCTCCVNQYWVQGEKCAQGVAQGSSEKDVAGCSYCERYADEEWEPGNCFTERNMGHCNHQYWNNQEAKCDPFNASC